MEYRERYEGWLSDPYFDEATKEELRSIANDDNEIKERFYKDLEFGTAGLRGIIGAGTNRMNIYTVRKATQGLANYIISKDGQKKGVAIAYDSRRMSPEFADEAALCLAANGIKAYVFESLRPTPELSYAVRSLGCIAGINITASHNPPEYNGYKVYWEDGAQITPPHDKGIMDEVKAVTDYNTVKTMGPEEAKAAGMYEVIGKEVDDGYIAELKKQVIHQDSIDAAGKELKIVYSPLHGTGNIPARRILKELGFENVYVVKEQELPDGEFPTVSYPNPEAEEAFELGLKLAKEVDADLVLATDPDADRLGVYVKDGKSGEYKVLTGNMSGCLLAMALCEAAAYYKTQGKTLWDAMVDMYDKYGYYKDDIKSITLKGIEGLQKIQEILETLRKNPPAEVGGYQVIKARDYQAETVKDIKTGEVTGTGLPKSNVLYYDLTDDAWLCVRPSGTEPKVKFYYGIKGSSLADADEKSAKLGEEVLTLINKML